MAETDLTRKKRASSAVKIKPAVRVEERKKRKIVHGKNPEGRH